MRFCDLTFAYTPTSGGIRTYIDQKRRYLLEHTPHEHVLIVPGETDRTSIDGRMTRIEIGSPFLPGCEPYRCFVRPAALLEALREAEPDIIELGSFFLEPRIALKYREERAKEGHRCLVSGFFHTDLADAYFGSPVRAALGGSVASWSEVIAAWLEKVGDVVEAGAASYFGSVFNRCDWMYAATPQQVERLASYDVAHAELVPLGVDPEQFHPRRRSPAVRARLGAPGDEIVLMYAGRLDAEKKVGLLLDAFAALPHRSGYRLVLLGEGPLREQLETRASGLAGIALLPHERNPDRVAELLASADIYVTAGPHETFGLSVIEAQASGLPVVGVDSGALRERVAPGTGLLGPPNDAAAMARHIVEAAAHRRDWGPAARAHVLAQGLTWDHVFDRWLQINLARSARPPVAA